MKSPKIWANLAISDVARTHAFYTALGIRPNSGAPAKDLTSFIFDGDDYVIHFFLADKLSAAAGSPMADLSKGSEVMFTIAAESKEEIAEWAHKVCEAGGTIFKQPGEDDHGYYGFGFTDPDGHKFNLLLVEGNM